MKVNAKIITVGILLATLSSGFCQAPGTKLWEVATGGSIYSAPAIGPDGTIYFGSDDAKLYAINSNGTPKWTFLAGGRVRSAPAVSPNGTIYISSDFPNYQFYAVSPSGSTNWNMAVSLEGNSPALGEDGTAYLPTKEGNLIALNPDGNSKWS